MNNSKNFHCSQTGFTLVELMVTLAVSILIAAALYATYLMQQRSYQMQSSVIEVQQNARTALDLMVRDLRMTGLDPDGTASSTIHIANQTSLYFSADMNWDGSRGTSTATDAPEYYAYRTGNRPVSGVNIPTLYRASNLDISGSATASSSYSFQPMADYIEQIEFFYEFEDGTTSTTAPTSAQLPAIRSIKISVIGRSRFPVKKVAETESFTLLSSNSWNSPNDKYLRRLVTTQVDLRNMGL